MYSITYASTQAYSKNVTRLNTVVIVYCLTQMAKSVMDSIQASWMHKWPMLPMFPHHMVLHIPISQCHTWMPHDVVWEHRQHWPFVHLGSSQDAWMESMTQFQTVDNDNCGQACYIVLQTYLSFSFSLLLY